MPARRIPTGASQIRAALLTAAVAVLAAALLGGCGSSDEEQVRAAAGEFGRSLDDKDFDRACELLTPRAEAQYTALFGIFARVRNCAQLVRQFDSDDEQQLTQREIDEGRVAIGGDLATLKTRRDEPTLGLRKIDGEWRIDNLLNGSLERRPRGDPRLARGTDEQQIRATLTAVSEAFARRQHARVCSLLSYGAEAQVLLGGAVAASAGSGQTDSELSCTQALRAIHALPAADEKDLLTADLPSPAQLAAAQISLRDSQARVELAGRSPYGMVRIDGRWLLDVDPPALETPADYERCWRATGASIAASARELRFASEEDASHFSSTADRVSVKGANWRIFYTLPIGSDDPGLGKVLRDVRSVAVVAYVKDAAAHAAVVRRARACGE